MSNIEVKDYTGDHHKAWDEFVRNVSRNGGIFQERDFLSYHPEGKFNDASLLFFEKGTLMAVFPAAIVSENGKEKVVSHPGSSCGGLIFHDTATLQQVLE
ncbi:MAG TPA: GNAT family N-acetyltransferase, partial [Bacteroidia bacterium]|nr:GNAT family N-acetyltransferase [Bacteroidia bacterium]